MILGSDWAVGIVATALIPTASFSPPVFLD